MPRLPRVFRRASRRASRRALCRVAGIALSVSAVSTAALAHDFWLVPNAFAVREGDMMEVAGRTSTRFPTSLSAVTPERVASARLLSARTDASIDHLSVEGKALRLRHRPAVAGQYVVAVALVARESRTTPAGLMRYVALEGAPALAERYQRGAAVSSVDSLTQVVSKFAKTIVEVGRGGPATFDRRVGHLLEIVPLNDARGLMSHDSLRVQVLYRGTPLAGAQLFAGGAVPADSAATGPALHKDAVVVTDASGVAQIPLGPGDVWNVRTLHAAPAPGGAADSRWEVLFATLVVQLAAGGHAPHPSAR